jgi:hypothetical protein
MSNANRNTILTTSLFLLVGSSMYGCGTPVVGQAFDANAPRFPSVNGDNLNGRAFEIPAGLDAPLNVLLVAFYREQQAEVDTWLDTAKQLSQDHANVEYYELPTINGAWSLVRGWIDGGMRSGIPAFAGRERTITIYTDTEKFRQLAGIDDPKRIWVGIVDREGRVFWSARGPATPELLADLSRAVRTAATPQTAK